MKKKGVRPEVILDLYIIQILSCLKRKDYSVNELAKRLEVAYQNLQLKLNTLEEGGIITLDRSGKGRTVVVKLNSKYKDHLYCTFFSTKELLDFMIKIRTELENGRKHIVKMEKEFMEFKKSLLKRHK